MSETFPSFTRRLYCACLMSARKTAEEITTFSANAGCFHPVWKDKFVSCSSVDGFVVGNEYFEIYDENVVDALSRAAKKPLSYQLAMFPCVSVVFCARLSDDWRSQDVAWKLRSSEKCMRARARKEIEFSQQREFLWWKKRIVETRWLISRC